MVDVTDQTNDLLTTQEVVDLLGVSLDTLAQWRTRKQGPAYIKHKGFVRYTRVDIDAWLDANRVETGTSETNSATDASAEG